MNSHPLIPGNNNAGGNNSNSKSTSTSNPSAPLKLTFRLGSNSNQQQQSTSSTTSSAIVTPSRSTPISEDNMDLDSSSSPLPDNISEAGSSVIGGNNNVDSRGNGNNGKIVEERAPLHWDNRGKLPVATKVKTEQSIAADSTKGVIVEGEVKPKQRRKRGPKRQPGEVGPGKSWRKGLKGNLAGVGAPPRVGSPNPTPYSYNPKPSNSTSTSTPNPGTVSTAAAIAASRSFPISAPPKIATTYLPVQVLAAKTPVTRKWNQIVKELTSVTGSVLRFKSWQGNTKSPYYDSVEAAAQAAALLNPPPLPALPPLPQTGTIPTISAYSNPYAHAVQHQPLPPLPLHQPSLYSHANPILDIPLSSIAMQSHHSHSSHSSPPPSINFSHYDYQQGLQQQESSFLGSTGIPPLQFSLNPLLTQGSTSSSSISPSNLQSNLPPMPHFAPLIPNRDPKAAALAAVSFRGYQ